MIVIVDYGLGNLGSIYNMLKRIKAEAIITSDVCDILKADKLILPGVGKYDAGMEGLQKYKLLEALHYKVLEEKVPILGICLGMQLMVKGSEEGRKEGLGWIDGYTYRFAPTTKFKVPHMGWNNIEILDENKLTCSLPATSKFYFVHSFYVKTENEKDTFLKTEHSVDFASGIHKENIYGVQFHPEKSHKYGMRLLDNFAKM